MIHVRNFQLNNRRHYLSYHCKESLNRSLYEGPVQREITQRNKPTNKIVPILSIVMECELQLFKNSQPVYTFEICIWCTSGDTSIKSNAHQAAEYLWNRTILQDIHNFRKKYAILASALPRKHLTSPTLSYFVGLKLGLNWHRKLSNE